ETANKDGESSPMIEVLDDESLRTSFDITEAETPLETLIEEYAEKNPKKAGIINIMLNFSDDTKQSEKTHAYCEYFGVQEYTTVIQKRVSRVRQSFKKFLENNNYEGVVA